MSYSRYLGNGFLLVVLATALSGQRAQENVVPLKNWATPLYWQPSQAERSAVLSGAPQLTFSTNQVSPNALTFIAITPCRLVDTRGGTFNGISPFSGPSIPGTGSITIPVQSTTEASTNTAPAPCGVIPSIAQAYSFNVTVVPHSGGAVDYVSLWPAGGTQPFVATLNDPQGIIAANAAIVPAGAPLGGISVYNAGPATTDVVIDMNGYFAAPTDANSNTAVGVSTLASNTTGFVNTAIGADALQLNTTGSGNTASGQSALYFNTAGSDNTANGHGAMTSNTTGSDNTASGVEALVNNTTGYYNTATGLSALAGNTTGYYNTATGDAALVNNTTGSNNIAIGVGAASSVSGGNSNNIHIGSEGAVGDSGVIKIGTQSIQTSTFIAGISGATPGTPNLLVCVDGNGTLGTMGCSGTPSSRRFKDQITDMGDSSNKLLELRPVTFLYKPEYDDGSHALQYGLIAEEVAKVYPDMVGYDKDGQPASVKYQSLAPMLLNEAQKQNAHIKDLEETVQLQREENRKLEDRLAALEALLSSQTAAATRPASSQ